MASVAAVVVGSALIAGNVKASPSIDALAACLADSTTGKDRKDMARWVFVGMASHPEIKSLANIKDSDREEMDKKMAALFTRLMTESCPAQAKTAMEKEGSVGFQSAFGVIGRLAMQELMSDPTVNSSFSNFAKYVDNSKIESVFKK